MAIRGVRRYSPRFPLKEQSAALVGAGVREQDIFTVGDDGSALEIVRKQLRKGDTLKVDGLHRLAPRWAELVPVLEAAAERNIKIVDARTSYTTDAQALYLTAEAQRVYNAEARMPSPEAARERGALAGEVHRSRRMEPGRKAQSMWNGKDAGKYRTNQDAADAVSLMLGRKVSVPTLRRRFGPSGRAAGWPTK